ncbi:hypothetical protein [Brevibacillus daliensis]|uniref:hypothetical protein n=1 Tax=Brevibacillus daliensis TaxID=2892995 RepID=UPI001E3A2CEE|nr:hypothetical protein [Brevibacillus daliensis]
MDAAQKIHLLSRELIPVINDLDENAVKVVLEHIHHCTECQHLYLNVMEMEENYPQAPIANEVDIKPLKKLVQFNRGLKLLLIAIRAVILLYIIYSGIQFYDWGTSAQAAISYIQSVTFLFYFPASLFLTIFTLVFFNKKWIWLSIIFDLTIILFIDRIITFFI